MHASKIKAVSLGVSSISALNDAEVVDIQWLAAPFLQFIEVRSAD
ncbi:MAG: hypothetical protein ACI4QS_12005 [Comamonas sp.]